MIDIERLAALEKAATPGPWKWGHDGWCADSMGSLFAEGNNRIISTCCDNCRGEDEEIMPHLEDAELIPAMRNALPDLLTELANLRAIVQELAETEPVTYDENVGYSECVLCGKYRGHEDDCLISRAGRR